MRKTSELLLRKNIKIRPYLHGAILSRIIETENNEYFVIPISFANNTKFNKNPITESDIVNYANNLNNLYPENSSKWCVWKSELKLNGRFSKPKIVWIIENDANITKDTFLKLVYFNLLNQNYVVDNNLNNEKKEFIRGFFESRGSIDYKAKFYSIDYFFDTNTTYDLKRVFVLFNYFSIPTHCLNINFRELQPDYVKNIAKRNTQLRINLDWYVSYVGLSFPYRIESLINNYSSEYEVIDGITYFKPLREIKYHFGNDLIIARLNFFNHVIFNNALSEQQIADLRIELGFDGNTEINRSQSERLRVYLEKPDECSGCKDTFKIDERSFLRRDNQKYYLEIHHNIPFSNDKKNLDVYDNMVKLCPTCHAALKKNRALEKYQKSIITKILQNDNDCMNFALTYFNLNELSFDNLVEKIYDSLL